MDQTKLVEAVDALTSEVGTLSQRADTTQKVLERIEKVAADNRRNRVGMAVLLVLIGLIVYLFFRLEATTREVREVQERTSSEILCPLYEVFATSIKVNPPNPNLTPDQAKARQHAADTILAGLDTLGCGDSPVGK
ncbi:hypothetical protein [Nocardia sp. CY41]|uniref:hypothetical protein n=1 Tax=Nocardia sp. CY41 TaxID=2608686 RepID=UPI00135B2B09|nr:hypothetical protein [Nocardia sp. CY41]